MKTTLIFLSILISSQGFGESLIPQETYVCQIENSDQSLTLMKLEDLPVSKKSEIDSKARYLLQIQTSELAFPSVEAKGTATTADVHLNFKSDDGQYQVHMYLDDAGGILTMNRTEYNFTNCRFF